MASAKQRRISSAVLALSIAVVFGATLGRILAQPGPTDTVQDWGRFALAGMLLTALPYVVALRRRRGRWDRVAQTNAIMLPLLSAPALLVVADTTLALTRGGVVVCAAMAVSLSVGIAVARRGGSTSVRAISRWTFGGVFAASIVVGAYLGYLAVVRHWSMQSNTYDLGLFTNAIWNTGQGRFFECTLVETGNILDEHKSPILLVLGAAMRLGLSVEGLLVGTALWLCGGAIAVYRLAVTRVGTVAASVLAFAYLLHPSLHANALWDFHPLSLASPALLWIAYLGPRGSRLGFWGAVCFLLSLREEMAFLAVCLAAYLAITGCPRRGRNLALVAVAYALALVALQDGEVSTHVARYATLAERGGGGLRGVVTALVMDPAFVVALVVEYPKAVFILLQFLPVALVSFFNPRGWILFAFGIAFTGLSSSAAVFNPFFHYSSVLYPCVFIAAPDALTRLTVVVSRLTGGSRRRARAGLTAAIVTASALATVAYGGLYDNASFRAGFTEPRRTLTDGASARREWLEAVVAKMPADRSLAVSGRIGPQVAQRPAVYAYPTSEDVDAMVLFLSELRPEHRRELAAGVRSGRWKITEESGSIAVYERVR